MKIEASDRLLINAAYKLVAPGQAKQVAKSFLKELYDKLEGTPLFDDLPMTPIQIMPQHLIKAHKYFFKQGDRAGMQIVRNVYAFMILAGRFRIKS